MRANDKFARHSYLLYYYRILLYKRIVHFFRSYGMINTKTVWFLSSFIYQIKKGCQSMEKMYEFVEYADMLPIRISTHEVIHFPLHFHPELELLLVLSGTVSVQIGDVSHLISQDQVVVISPNVPHETRQTGTENSVLAIQINCGKFGPYETGIDTMTYHSTEESFPDSGASLLREHMLLLNQEMSRKESGYLYMANAHVQTILGTLVRSFQYIQKPERDATKSKEKDRLGRIVSYIKENYATRITLSDLAAREFLSVNHLSTFIHKALGMRFGAYVNAVRLKHYMTMLQTEETPLEEIAMRCGFSSPQYASSLFQEVYGTTPGRYRRQHRQRHGRIGFVSMDNDL